MYLWESSVFEVFENYTLILLHIWIYLLFTEFIKSYGFAPGYKPEVFSNYLAVFGAQFLFIFAREQIMDFRVT